MLFSLGHGQRIVVTNPGPARSSAPESAAEPRHPTVSLESVTGVARKSSAKVAVESVTGSGGPFNYYFPDAAGPADDPDIIAKLSALADAMVEPVTDQDSQADNSLLPPVLTYLGQFIDHDITANTDRDTASSNIAGPDISPLPRSQVVNEVMNLRHGTLGLDSLYGGGPAQDDFSKKLEAAMRHPTIKGKMRLGLASPAGGPVDLPADPAVDLLRLGKLIDAGTVTVAELQALPPELSGGFLNGDGTPLVQKAIIGDGRNDENLIVAQLQVAFLRFHNKVVDWVAGQSGSPTNSDGLFAEAQKLVRWHYQWLVVNYFLPQICDATIVDRVKSQQAPQYSSFYDDNSVGNPEAMPLPLEFSVAAYRYGHTMVRANYDYNRFFGRPTNTTDGPNRAGFDLLFFFTGRTDGNHDPMFGLPTLPDNWIIEWERFVRSSPTFPDRVARKVDPLLAPPLKDMINEDVGVFRHLAERNLRRGHRLNIPTAQACIAEFSGTYGSIDQLSENELASGSTGDAIRNGGFLNATPLWFYVLKEAEIKSNGERLGPLGSLIVAETLIGLCVKDPGSYWNQSGSDSGRWHPQDGAKPDGHTITNIEALLESTGQLASLTS